MLNWPEATALPACDNLLLVVPAPMLSWHRVTLPRLPSSQWRQALWGLLEDRLLGDASNTHLALNPGAAGGQTVQVAACDKTWLSQTLQALERAGRRPTRIVPECVPDGSGLHLLGTAEQGWLVQCEEDQVLSLPLSHPARESLQVWCTLHPSVPVQAEPGLTALAEALWGQPPGLYLPAQRLQRAVCSGWDLAQFDLRLARTWPQRLVRALQQAWVTAAWRPVRRGLALLLLVQLLGLLGWAWKAEQQQRAMHQEIRQIYTRTFGAAQPVIDPLRQMERDTHALAQSAGQAARGDLAPLLVALADLPGASPDRLEYRAGELTLPAWTPPSSQDLQALQARLARGGLALTSNDGRWTLRPLQTGGTP